MTLFRMIRLQYLWQFSTCFIRMIRLHKALIIIILLRGLSLKHLSYLLLAFQIYVILVRESVIITTKLKTPRSAHTFIFGLALTWNA